MNRKMFRAMKRNPKLQEEVRLINGRKMSRADAIEYYEACIGCTPNNPDLKDYIKSIKHELCRLYKDTGLRNPYAKFDRI